MLGNSNAANNLSKHNGSESSMVQAKLSSCTVVIFRRQSQGYCKETSRGCWQTDWSRNRSECCFISSWYGWSKLIFGKTDKLYLYAKRYIFILLIMCDCILLDLPSFQGGRPREVVIEMTEQNKNNPTPRKRLSDKFMFWTIIQK